MYTNPQTIKNTRYLVLQLVWSNFYANLYWVLSLHGRFFEAFSVLCTVAFVTAIACCIVILPMLYPEKVLVVQIQLIQSKN